MSSVEVLLEGLLMHFEREDSLTPELLSMRSFFGYPYNSPEMTQTLLLLLLLLLFLVVLLVPSPYK